jgi:hypothetical protein
MSKLSLARVAPSLLSLGFAAGCSLTSVDQYFECPKGMPNCMDSQADAGKAGTGSDSNPRGQGEPGDACVESHDCAEGVCFRGVCGGTFDLTYADTPDTESDPDAAQWIKFRFSIQNRTTDSYGLGSLRLRYYYTPEDVSSEFQALSTSLLPQSRSEVSGDFGTTTEAGSKHWSYLEIGFTADAGALESGQATGNIKVGIHDRDFGAARFYQPDDFSYQQPNHLALFLDSELVAGEVPLEPPVE